MGVADVDVTEPEEPDVLSVVLTGTGPTPADVSLRWRVLGNLFLGPRLCATRSS
jgi:hypothetical protein